MTRRLRLMLMIALLAVAPLSNHALAAQDNRPVWAAWSALDVTTLGDDGSGSVFVRMQIDGIPVIEVMPGGDSDETKLAWAVSGAVLQDWTTTSALELGVYLPESNTLNPDAFFLGLGDMTGAWAWVDGVFGSANAEAGWVTVRYPLSTFAGRLDANHAYEIYLSFFEQANKTPLTEPFYLGDMRLVPSGSETQGAGDAAALLELEDAVFVEAVARQSFDYFWQEANPDNGLIRDRSTPTSPASIAAVGFGLAALPIGVERGWITRDEGLERARATLTTFLEDGVQGERGFYYHFVDMQTGQRVWDSELSSIDTALLAAGALVAGQYFADTEVQGLANELYERIEWDWMTDGGEFVRMGWTPEGGFLGAAWDHFDESLLLYALAFGSPTHPIPADAWANWSRPIRGDDESIYLPGDPLFVYQYPLAFLNLRGLEDAYANYWNNTVRACQRHYDYILDNQHIFETYSHGAWGLSASDGPGGYRAYGATDVNNDGTIAPYASAACLPFTPDIAFSGMRALLAAYGDHVWREYGFVSAVNEDADWYSRDHIGIDQGDILLMLANAQDGLVWNLFMSHPAVQAALNAMGFVPSSGDYAVTPEYFAERVGR